MNEHERETISDWKLERFLLGELDLAEMESIRHAAANDQTLRARLDALRQSNEEILREYPPGWMGRRIRDHAGPGSGAPSRMTPKRRAWPILRPIAPVALAAVLVLALLVGLPLGPPDEVDPDGIRLKGATEQLRVYRKTENGSAQLQSGDRVAEHDVVLLQYQTEEPCFGTVFSMDGRGTLTQHLPQQGSHAVELLPGQAHFLEHAYELDDAPRWEVFFLVTSPIDFSLETVTRALEEAIPPAAPALPDGFRLTTFTLVKEPSHED